MPVAALEKTVNTTNVWLKELCEIGHFEDESQAYSAFRAVLHSIRDRLPIDEAAHLGAQLPMLVRGFYFEGWKPALAPNRERKRQEFIESVRESLRGNMRIEPVHAIQSCFVLLDRKISGGEIADVYGNMPQDVRELWNQSRAELGQLGS